MVYRNPSGENPTFLRQKKADIQVSVVIPVYNSQDCLAELVRRLIDALEGLGKNYEIIYYIDLYFLISTCNILITSFSTVGTETIYFSKPLIILDPLKQDIQNYHKEGIAFQATNSKELKNFIKNILCDDLRISNKLYKAYIEKYVFKIDEKVSERCFTFIKHLVQIN